MNLASAIGSSPGGDPILIHGEEPFLVDRDVRAWLVAARRLSLTDLDVEIIDQLNRLDIVRRSLQEVPFLAERRFVLLRDPPQLSERVRRGADNATQLAELIALRAPSSSLCLVAHNRIAPQNPVPAAVRAAGGRVVEHPRLRAGALRTWLERAVVERGLRLPRAAVDHLIQVSGGDLGVLNGELGKLADFGAGGPITLDDVRHLASGAERVEIWEVVERLLAPPHGRGPAALDSLLAQGVAPQQLIAVLGGQFRELLRTHELLADRGRDGAGRVAAHLGVPSWRAERLVRWTGVTTSSMVEGWLRSLQHLDAEMKQGRLDDVAALRSMMLRAAREVAERRGRPSPAAARPG